MCTSKTHVDPTARQLMRDFPGWLCWYGPAIQGWWGLPPYDHGYPRLVEGTTPDELAARIRQTYPAGGRARAHPDDRTRRGEPDPFR